MNSIFFGRLFRYVSGRGLSIKYPILFNGLKSVVTKYIEPTALVQRSYDILKVNGGALTLTTTVSETTTFAII